MWFTDTAGVDKIFVGYNPSRKELETPAFKPYSAIYRLLYSFHSSFEEIIDFVNVLKPKRLHPIALPESTSEQIINEYFYNYETNMFHGFQANANFHSRLKKNNSDASLQANQSNLAAKPMSTGVLMLRKRTFDSFTSLIADKSSGESSDDNSLVFESSEEENLEKSKKIKK